MIARRWARLLSTAIFTVSTPSQAQKALAADMKASLVGDIAQWFGPDSYPPAAVRAQRAGRVVAEIGVDAKGAVTSCSVATSSGTTSLDAKTCEIAFAHLRFDPATDSKGFPVASTYPLAVRWQLPDTTAPSALELKPGVEDSVVSIEYLYDRDGNLLSCTELQNTFPLHNGSPCSSVKVGAKALTRWTRNGVPIGVRVVERLSAHVTPLPSP